MLSKKAKYAIKALIYLSKSEKEGPVLISEIATSEGIPQKFLELILLSLKNQGILHSQRGKNGGYMLGKPASEITVGALVRIIDGPLAPVNCVSVTAYQRCVECKDEGTCEIHFVMQHVRDAIAAILDKTSLEDAINHKLPVGINL